MNQTNVDLVTVIPKEPLNLEEIIKYLNARLMVSVSVCQMLLESVAIAANLDISIFSRGEAVSPAAVTPSVPPTLHVIRNPVSVTVNLELQVGAVTRASLEHSASARLAVRIANVFQWDLMAVSAICQPDSVSVERTSKVDVVIVVSKTNSICKVAVETVRPAIN